MNVDLGQKRQAEKELKTAEEVLPKAARECYRWLLCPSQASPTAPHPTVEAFPLNTGGASLGAEIERLCQDNELIITAWSPIHLRTRLKELYWKDDKTSAGAMAFWEDTLRYLYLPRLKSATVLEQAIVKGAASRDFFGTAYGGHDGKFDGFKLGDANVQLDDTLLLIEPEAAARYALTITPLAPQPGTGGASVHDFKLINTPAGKGTSSTSVLPGSESGAGSKPHAFHGNVTINASTAKMRLVQVADEIIAVLAADPNADLKVTVEIQGSFPNGASDQTKRAVTENARTLGFKNADWE